MTFCVNSSLHPSVICYLLSTKFHWNRVTALLVSFVEGMKNAIWYIIIFIMMWILLFLPVFIRVPAIVGIQHSHGVTGSRLEFRCHLSSHKSPSMAILAKHCPSKGDLNVFVLMINSCGRVLCSYPSLVIKLSHCHTNSLWMEKIHNWYNKCWGRASIH